MSVKGYARARGADPKTIRRKIAEGVIARDADGLIDPEQADAAWASTRQAPRQHINGEAGAQAATARIAAAASKLRLMQQRFEQEDGRYTDRAAAAIVARCEARYALDVMHAAPDSAAADAFARSLGIDTGIARTILRKFIALVLAEVGDLEAQAMRDVEMA